LALKEFSYNKKFYDISTDLGQIPKLDKIPDKKLYNLLFNNNVRQMMHISYGSLLSAFRKEIYKTLFKFEEEFYEFVIKHLQKHLNKQICSI
jgi:thiamine biosynthesis lipoprotein ApbE